MKVSNSDIQIKGSEKKPSHFVTQQLPNHIVNSESFMVNFLEAYYEWAQQQDAPIGDSRRLPEYTSVNLTPQKFIEYFVNEFLPGLPTGIAADKRLLLKHSNDLYKSKGSKKSFELLFRILFDEDVQVTFPKENILRASDGIWTSETIIRVDNTDLNIDQLSARKIYGRSSGASAVVESIRSFFSGEFRVNEIVLAAVEGVFAPDEIIETRDTPVSGELPKVEARIYGIAGSYKINNGGSGYKQGDLFSLSDSGDGTDFVARVGGVSSTGAITKIKIVNPGIGFYNSPPVIDEESTSSGTGADIDINITGQHVSIGEYQTEKGHISSSSILLQDGEKYQEYSYVLTSKIPVYLWEDVVRNILHPAGLFLSGSLNQVFTMDDVDNGPILFHLSQPDGPNYNHPDYASTQFFFEPILIRNTYQLDGTLNPRVAFANSVWRVLPIRFKRLIRDGFITNLNRYTYTSLDRYRNTTIKNLNKRKSYPEPFQPVITIT